MQAWVDARKRHGLSHAEVQMARELEMNPKKLGKLDKHDQEPWKMPLRQFIRHLYVKRFGNEYPDSSKRLRKRFVAMLRKSNLARSQGNTQLARFLEGLAPLAVTDPSVPDSNPLPASHLTQRHPLRHERRDRTGIPA
jgi:hypothetical protein